MMQKKNLTALVMLVFFTGLLITPAQATRFVDFSATVGIGADPDFEDEFWGNVLSGTRDTYQWEQEEGSQGFVEETWQAWWKARVLAAATKGCTILPIFAYNTAWSWDQSERTYYDLRVDTGNLQVGDKKWNMLPLGSNQFRQTQYSWNGSSWVEQSYVDINCNDYNERWCFPIKADCVDDWEDFVERTVIMLRASPFNQVYFQPWNEANMPNYQYWYGGWDTYFDRMHNPASQKIRAHGGKVVWGGWLIPPVDDYIYLLDRYNAWSTIDVLDLHYWARQESYNMSDLEVLRQAAATRGYPDMGIWQTEEGATTDSRFVANVYPRFIYWGLNNGGDTNPDKFRFFWYGFSTSEGPGHFEYERFLKRNLVNYEHGTSLQTLSELLSGEGLATRTDITNSRSWIAELNEDIDNSVEAFEIVNRVVVAVHTNLNSGTIDITIPNLLLENMIKAQRVDPSGYTNDITGSASQSGSDIVVTVDIAHDGASPINSWNMGGMARTFYLNVAMSPTDCDQTKTMGHVLQADLDGNCRVDLDDFTLFVADWLNCMHPDDVGCEHLWE